MKEETKVEKPKVLKVLADEIRTPSNPRKQVAPCDEGGKLRYHPFRVEFPEDAKLVEAVLTKLPPGKIRILGALSYGICYFKNPGFRINIGWLEYKIPLQGKQERTLEGLDRGITKPVFSLGTRLSMKTETFETDEGFHIAALLAGNFVKGDSMKGYIIYVKD